MSFLTYRILRPSTTFNAASVSTSLLRSSNSQFHTSSFLQSLNEADRHEDHEKVKRDTDHHKNDQLQKQKEGKGQWKPELASQSEAAVRADRADIDTTEETIKGLQKETEEAIHGKK
ncbi:MAG: hypothetical protein MMC33_009321 [Icmadophila ericetorum]|nr:hypothetical protein [Icmadophila ericetorum]